MGLRRMGNACLALAALVAGCSRPQEAGVGGVRVQVASLGSTSIAGARLVVSAGAGPAFPDIVTSLAPDGSGGWSGRVAEIPAGPGRRFTVEARGYDGETVSGEASSDIVAGRTAVVRILLDPPPARPYENSAPVLDYLGASGDRVAPGETVRLTASAHDPDASDAIAYRWQASCGTLEAAATPNATWRAPDRPERCELDVMVVDEHGALVSADLEVEVEARRVLAGRRLVTFWPDPPALPVAEPSPDVAGGVPPTAWFRGCFGDWYPYPGGHLEAGGTFVPGSYAADGSWAIADAPDGPYVLCVDLGPDGWACGDTANDEVDLGYDLLGRPDVDRATRSTPLGLSLSGLDAWNPNTDRIELTSSAADVWDSFAPPFRGGDTSGDAVENFGAAATGEPLDLLGPADTLFVHQLSTRSFHRDGEIHLYVAATRSGAFTGLAMADGVAAHLDAPLDLLPLIASELVDWPLTRYESHHDEMAPAGHVVAGGDHHALTIAASAFPVDGPGPVAAGSPGLVRIDLPAGTGDVATTVYHGRFLGDLWNEWRSLAYAVPAVYLAPGATAPWMETAWLERRDAVPAPPGTAPPAVTPVLAPRVNGADAFADVAAPVGTTPTISWSPPASGAPDGYVVDVIRLGEECGRTTGIRAVRYVTQTTSITIPPGLLRAGSPHFARITALVAPLALDSAPLRWAVVHSRADALTGTFTP